MCPEMQELRTWLDNNGIDWEDVSTGMEGCWIDRTHFEYNGVKWSVINGNGTYGGTDFLSGVNAGLLEIMGAGKDPIGWLTAADVIEIIQGKGE